MFNTLSIIPPAGPETARLSTAAPYLENTARNTAYTSQFSSIMSTNGGGNTHEIKKPMKQLRGGGWVMSNKKVLSQQRGSTQGS